MNFIALLCFIGGVQGIFLCIHFWIKESGKPVLNRLVAVLLFVYSLNLLNTFTFLAGYSAYHQFLQPPANYLNWWVGPSLWLYVRYPNMPEDWSKVLGYHYATILPFVIVGTIWPSSSRYLGMIYYLQLGVYLSMTVKLVLNEETDRRLVSWIEPLVYTIALIYLANVTLLIMQLGEIFTISDTVRVSFILLAAIPIFLIAYREMNARQTFVPEPKKYGESGLEDQEIEAYLKQIQEVMGRDQLYLDPKLTVADVSKATGIQKRKISQVINQSLDKNFSTFVNEYRLEEVTRKLADPNQTHLSILGIAQESGFNSGGRFNTLFKKYYGVTPSQYREKALQGV